MKRDTRYSEEMRNCQTFAADLYGFLAGKAGIQPFHKVCRVFYQNRSYLFLYDAGKYSVRLPGYKSGERDDSDVNEKKRAAWLSMFGDVAE
jgi:hypothetical protein